ncbi:hypothetical protein BaRGS_00040231, partial [Batillaria attramentaria]
SSETMLGTYLSPIGFLPTSSDSHHPDVQYEQDVGFLIRDVSAGDSGSYLATAAYSSSANITTSTIHLTVYAPPVLSSGSLEVHLEDKAVKVPDGDWHAQLSCGNFSDLGHPPVSVEWETPSGNEPSSTAGNSSFFFNLPNPAKGGNYTCIVKSSIPSDLACPEQHVLTHTFGLNENTARVTVLEAQYNELKRELEELRNHTNNDGVTRAGNQHTGGAQSPTTASQLTSSPATASSPGPTNV